MADSKWMQRLENRIGALAAHSHRHPWRVLLLGLVLSAAGMGLASKLSLNADLVELLPRSFQSVKDIRKLQQRFGGTGWVVVVGEGAEPESLRRFADDLAPRLSALNGIRFVETQRPSAFFAEHALYYLEKDDLEEVFHRLEAREKFERRKRNPLLLKFTDEAPPPLEFGDLLSKYAGKSSARFAGKGEPYYLDKVNRRVVLLVKPDSTSADLGYSKRVVGEVEALLRGVDAKQYGPDFQMHVTGTFKKKLDQQAQIGHDIATSSTLALLVLLVYLVFHFRSALAVLISLVPVGAALAWIYGGVAVAFGQVNLLTGFLGAILGGLGVEHGIHLLTRYFALRQEGQSSEDATRESFTHTGGSALISALVAALTFLALAISDFRAFREFGLIAGAGMLLMVFAYVLLLPGVLGMAHRLGWKPPAPADASGSSSWIARALPKLRWPIAVGMGLLVLGLTVHGRAAKFDFDFAALEDQHLPSFVLDKQVNAILGYSQTPVLVLTDSPEQERAVVAELTRRKQELGEKSTIDFVGALDDLVPRDQEQKREIMEKIGALLARVSPEALDAPMRQKFEMLDHATRAQPFTLADLPAGIRRQFQGKDGRQGDFVLIFPRISLSDGARVRDLAREVRGLRLAGGVELSAAGEAMVLADILDMVTSEGPVILLAALVSVLVAMWVTLGNLKNALLCLTPTLVSILALAGLMPLMKLPFNYLNILVLPVLIGTTVDAGVHLLGRLSETDAANFTQTYAETGRAICGGLLTSAVGFGALMLADHPGLNSIGMLANLGFAANLLIMIVGFPALLLLLNERRDRARSSSHS